jgi:hypothetical protein
MIDATHTRADAIEARKKLKSSGHRFTRLLSPPEGNPKLAKSNAGLEVLTAPLHLAPASLSGHNVCPMSTHGCRVACLHTAGNLAFMVKKHKSRVDRTRAYFSNRDAFMTLLSHEIAQLCDKARAMEKKPGIRLNATSDVPWESVPVTIAGQRYKNLMSAFPQAQFYDYTKRANRRNLPTNYHLTFSLAEDNDALAIQAAKNGLNIAVVFDVGRTRPLPEFATIRLRRDFVTLPVIDGDEHDYRPIDPHGVIVGLRAKGEARKDKSGFVRSAS